MPQVFALRSRCLSVAAALVLAANGNASARPLDDVIASGEIAVALYDDFMPWSDLDGDSVRGIDAEIGREIGRKLGVKVRFVVRGAGETIDDDLRFNIWKGTAVQEAPADVMLHVPYDRQLSVRNDLVVVHAPYHQDGWAVAYDPEKLPNLKDVQSFEEAKVGVETDSAADLSLMGAFGGALRDNIVHFNGFMPAADAFAAGELPAVMATRGEVEWAAKRRREAGGPAKVTRPEMPGPVRRVWSIGIAVRENSRDLAYAIEDVLAELGRSGRMGELFAAEGVTFEPPEN
ncbi:MAG: transporter substrate-binding domain-containing protein [Hyphomicrobiaceae bacterium]|nr:transporter substrate-binding domain-containing protein [Hyphomicrobiaceae bacterium]